MLNDDLFEPFERLVEIELLGERKYVPENNLILRCFQFLSMKSISYGDFCWNGDCANCQVWVAGESKNKPLLSCRTNVSEGMKIVRISDEIIIETDEPS